MGIWPARSAADRDTSSPTFLTTIPPITDLVGRIVEGRADVVGLLPGGASPHTYEPRPSDLRAADAALALIYVDSRLDGWAARLPVDSKIALLELLPDSLILFIGDREPDHDQTHHEGHNHVHDHSSGPDPHFWTDPMATRTVVNRLAARLGDLDQAGRETYDTNAEAIVAELDSLHRRINKRTAAVRSTPVLLSHPFLRYYLDRYGIAVSGVIEAIPGKEPTAKDLARTIRETRDGPVRLVLTLPQLSRRAADLVAESCGLEVRVVDPLGGVEGRETYEEILLGITDTIAGETR